MTCNGQAPFVTVFTYLDEVEDGQTRQDLALIIEESIKNRDELRLKGELLTAKHLFNQKGMTTVEVT